MNTFKRGAYISSNIQTTQPKVVRRFRRLCDIIKGVAHTPCFSSPQLSVIGLDLLQFSIHGGRSTGKCKECGVLSLEGSRNALHNKQGQLKIHGKRTK